MITPAPELARYHATPVIDGFVVMLGETPFFVIAGEVAAPWSEVVQAVRHGWTIKAGNCDGTITVRR